MHRRQRGTQLKRRSGKPWDGALLGLEIPGGAPVKVTKTATGKVEERFGYAKGQEQTATTRIGVPLSFLTETVQGR